MLFIMREVYRTKGIFEDNQTAQGDVPGPPGASYMGSSVTSPVQNQTASFFPYSIGNKVDGMENPVFIAPPSSMPFSPSDGAKPTIIGARPVVTPDAMMNSRAGMDPTVPPVPGVTTSIGPPPLTGFVRKN